MADLTTTYLGLKLKNPVIVGACDLTADMDKIKKLEEAGAGALVIRSLFEEQIQLESYMFEQETQKYDDMHADSITTFPGLQHAGPREHLMWVKKTKDTVSIPVIASINAVHRETWIDYAKQLEETGVDALELNFYAVPLEFDKTAEEIEKEQLEIIKEIKKAVSIPVSVKLSPFYTNILNFVKKLDKIGVDGYIIFNQFFQPDFDIEKEENIFPLNFSVEKDNRLPLRYAGLLHDNVKGKVCASTGIMNGRDVIKMLMAGADATQVVTVLYQNKIEYLKTMIDDLNKWMDKKGYKCIDDFKGKMSRKKTNDIWAYKRAQYIRMLLKSNPLG